MSAPRVAFLRLGLWGVSILFVGCSVGANVPELTPSEAEELRSAWFGGGPTPSDETARQQWRDREQALAECMSSHGVEFTPRPYPSNPLWEALNAERLRLEGSREYAERFGYGWTTSMRDDEIVQAYAEAHPYVDPNAERLAGTDLDTRLAYLEAMHGPATPLGRDQVADSSEIPEEFETSDHTEGCMTRVGAGLAGELLPEQAQQEYQGIADKVAANSDVAAARAAWGACMRDAGLPVADHDDIVSYLGGQVRFDGEETVIVDVPGEGEVQLRILRHLPSDLEAAIQRETRVALADFDCETSSGLREVVEQVEREAQLDWVLRWADRLAAQG